MERDFDLIWRLLRAVEELDPGDEPLVAEDLAEERNLPPETIWHNLSLIIEEEWILGHVTEPDEVEEIYPASAWSLTWEGHDVLADVETPNAWTRARSHLGETLAEDAVREVRSALDTAARGDL